MALTRLNKRAAETSLGGRRTSIRRTDAASAVAARDDESDDGAVAHTQQAADEDVRLAVGVSVRGRSSSDHSETARLADHSRDEDQEADDKEGDEDGGDHGDGDDQTYHDQDALRNDNEDDEVESCSSTITETSGDFILPSELFSAEDSDTPVSSVAPSESSNVTLAVGSDGEVGTGRTPPSSVSSSVYSLHLVSEDDTDAPPARGSPPRPPLYVMAYDENLPAGSLAGDHGDARTPSPEWQEDESV